MGINFENINTNLEIECCKEKISEEFNIFLSKLDKIEISLLNDWADSLDDSEISDEIKRLISIHFTDHINDAYAAMEDCEKMRKQNVEMD